MSKAKLPDHFHLPVGDTTKTIKMTYGLLNEVTRTFGDIEAVAEISSDPALRAEVLNQLLAERDELGHITTPVNLFQLEVTADDVVDLIEWAGAHVTDFLLKQLVKTKAIMDSQKEILQTLMPS